MSDSLSSLLPVVCFDAVGTLIHPVEPVAETYARAGRRYGFELSPEIVSRRFREAFEWEERRDRQGDLQTDEEREKARWRTVIGHVFHDQPNPLAPFEELWNHYARPEAWTCYPDVVRFLDWLRTAGGRYAIASNFDRRLQWIVRGLPPLADAWQVVISSEVGWRKPARKFFELLADRMGCRSAEMVYIGDSYENDFQPASALGMQAFLLNRGSSRSAPPFLVSLDELSERLKMMRKCRHDGEALRSHAHDRSC